jgi:hypothetical protein
MLAHAGHLQLYGWRWIFLLLMVGGVVASFLTLRLGLGFATHLSDGVPWGLCLGLNVFGGMALAVGALTLACIDAMIGGSAWLAVKRACLLAGCLSYAVAILGSVANALGDNVWQAAIRGWTARSVLSGALWTVLLLALLLFLEFLPQHELRLRRATWFHMLQRLKLPLLILATVLAAVHQAGLTRLIGLSGDRFSPLWTGSDLFVLFYLSSVIAALAVLLFASWRSHLAFGTMLPAAIQPLIARLLTAAVFVYLLLRLLDLMERGLMRSVFSTRLDGVLVLIEIVLLLMGMVWIKGNEEDARELFPPSALIIAGVIANRLNTAITALEAGSGQTYLPRWGEFFISYSLIAAGVAGFALGVKHLSVFNEAEPLRS